MLRQGLLSLMIAAGFILGTACTGGVNSAVTGANGSIKITPGGKLTIDLEDVKNLNVEEYTLSLRTVKDDYSASNILLDLTSLVSTAGGGTKFSFVLPKNISGTRPLLVVADIPALNTQLIDVIYDGDESAKPGIASTMTYTLLKYYPGKKLSDFSGSDYQGIQDLAQTRMDELLDDSDYLSLSTTEYKKVIRYFTNGLAFNPTFLTAIRQFGVNYGFSLTTPSGITAADTPENSLNNYKFATAFTVGGIAATTNPFNQTNNPPMLMPGASQPNPGTGLFLPEGKKVSVTTQGFDIDDDYIDKNMIIQYIPRVLPSALTTAGDFKPELEHAPEYINYPHQTGPAGIDSYTSSTITYSEALDTSIYPTTLPFDAAKYPTAVNTDTAYRNVYYMISDGMIRVPYRWNFKYSDINRQPVIVKDANGKMNSTELDATVLAPGETETYPGTHWLTHGSHCESDDTATYSYTDPVTHLIAYAYYQVIKDKSESPWSCVFRVTDPDIDDDPNAAADGFYFSVNMNDNYTTARFGDSKTKIWPVYVGPPYVADRLPGTVLTNCVTPDGKTHPRCGRGLYQIVIDNSVKAAAESKSNMSYTYDVVVYDRNAAQGGYSSAATLNRTIMIPPQPARLINYSAPVLPSGSPALDILTSNGNGGKIYVRQDTYLSELMFKADPAASLGNNLAGIGFGDGVNTSPIAGTANRANFLAGTSTAISPFVTQPFSISGSSVTLDAVTKDALSATPGTITLLGHDMTTATASTYKNPFEYDSTCKLSMNNQDLVAGWDQSTTGKEGWTFEIDAIDYDNVALNVGEASDPVHVTLAHDVYTALNTAGFQFCSYKSPNNDPAYYQTYLASGTQAAQNPDSCTWGNTLPQDMQPIPLYYSVVDNGVTVVKKLVYHRLRFKWQPKDQGLNNGKIAADPAGYIKNMIKSGMQTSGQRFLLLNEPMDQNTVTTSIDLYAKRKDMIPCLSGLSGTGAVPDVIHQLNTSLLNDVAFSVKDENKVLASNPTYAGALMGRFESDLTLLGSRSITDAEFLKFIPFALNCSRVDTVLASGASPTPPPTKVLKEPLIWYTKADDTNNTPRIRFQSFTDPASATSGQFCMNFSYTPLTKSAVPYNEVILIQNLKATPWVLTNATLTACTARTSLDVNPDQKYIAIASTCGGSHTLNQSLWSDTNSAAISKFILDPTSAANGGYPAGSTTTIDMFPSMYQSDLNTVFPAGYNAANGMFFSADIFDNFKLDPALKIPVYSGYSQGGFAKWLPDDATNAISAANPVPFPSPGYAYGIQFVDWDNQPTYMSIATPTPNAATSDVFFRKAPGDANRIQVYVKNHATVTFPIKASDASGALNDLDAFDVLQFALVAPAATPNATPSFVGIGRSTCKDAPSGYPGTLSTLNVSALDTYKQCNFNWTPSALDDGKKYSYTFDVQDNYLSTWVKGPLASIGAGARHPSGINSNIVNDAMSNLNGPQISYNIDIEAIETNVAPFFTNSGGTTLTSPYNTAGGAAGWTSVFPSSAPTGKQTTCASSQTYPAYDLTHTSFPCDLTVASGDTLQNSTPIDLTEGSQQSFTVYAKDSNVTVNLKTVTAAKPTKVYIIDGAHAGRTYTVPSFSAMSMATSQNISAGTANFTFSWTPTDSEANFLSNPGGFLIPITISDTPYYAGSDSAFPTQFVVPAKSNTIWIWAKLSVRNSQPLVYYMNGTSEVPLSGATLTLQTGMNTSYTVRVKDTDIARWTQSGNYTDYSLAYTGFTGNSGSPFTTASPAGTPYYSAPYLIQEFKVNGNPTSNDIGIYSSPYVGVTDPGDPSLGLAINPDGSTPPKSQVFSTGNYFTTPFNFQVIGKPIFLAPSATNYQAYVYAGKAFYYPLSLFISRPTELLQPFFVGIDNATTVTPVKKATSGANSTGVYVNENYVMRWPDASVLNITNPPNRVIPVYGVLKSYCDSTLASPAITLVRFNNTTSAMETCKLSAANLSSNASGTNVTLTLVDNSQLSPTPAPITLTEVSRTYQPASTPADLTYDIDRNFSDFLARCANCTNATAQNAGPVTQNVTSTAYQMNAVLGLNSSIEYNYGSYLSRIEVKNAAAPFKINKIYQDLTPGGSRTLNVSASKGETLTFKATANASATAPYYQYRWYVNGCLKASGFVDGSIIAFPLKITSLMNGVNNDCTGEYGFTETGATALGKLVVRLSLVNGTEAITSASEMSAATYIWNVNVLNSDPNIITSTSYTPSNPIVLNTSYMSGNANVQFAMPVSYANKNFFAFTDLNQSTGLKVRLREFNVSGDLPSTGSNLALNCDASFNVQPAWIGLQPQTDGALYISASINNSYPTGSTAGLVYGQKSSTCFTKSLTLAANSQNFVSYSSSTVPAGFLPFSKYSMSNRASASFQTAPASTLYQSITNDSTFFLLDGANATNQFWSYSLAGMYSTLPAALKAPFTNNSVRKNIVSGNKLFQFVGAAVNNASGWRGWILMADLTQKTSPNNQVTATPTGSIMFADPTASAPAPTANDCNFNGTPLDGVYVPGTDTLYVFASSTDISGKAHLVAIKHISTTPACTRIGDLTNPSLLPTDHNPNISKMAFDSASGMIYGIVNQGTNLTSQFYAYDIYNQTLVYRDLSATLSSYELIYSPGVNGLYLFDNRKTATAPIYTPTLYKIW